MEKTKNKKITIKFIIILILATIAGGICGYAVASQGEGAAAVIQSITSFLQSTAHILLAANLLIAVVSFCYYVKGNRFAKIVKPEDEDAFENADCAYSIALNLTSVCLILSLVFFGFATSNLTAEVTNATFVDILVSITILIITLLATIVLQYLIVNATKVLYPEKRGNVLDLKFQKDWFASCDEAEQKMIGECGYRSYTALSQIIPFLFLGCVLLNVAIDMGVVPYILLGIVWLVLSQSYYFSSVKLQKKKSK